MSLRKIKFGNKEVNKKNLFIKTSYFIRFCRFKQSSCFKEMEN